MNAPPRSGSEFPAPGLTEAVRPSHGHRRLTRTSSDPDGARALVQVTDPVSSVTQREPGSPHPAPAPTRYCRVKGCGRRVVRGRLGLPWVHAEHSPFPHYARGTSKAYGR